MERLHAAFHQPSRRAYRVVDAVVWALIVFSIVLWALEELVIEPYLSRQTLAVAHAVDKVILGLFAIELGLRVLTFRPPVLDVFERPPLGALRTHLQARLAFLLRPSQLIDLLTIVAVVPALRGLRALRLLRLLRTVRVFKYGNPFGGLVRAFEADRLLFVFAFGVLGVQTIVGGISIYLAEREAPAELSDIHTVGQGIWWALVTLTTVGYGDYAPVTPVGRAIGGVLMIGGMITLALFAGIVGHSLLNAVLSIREESFRMSGYVKHIIVCGYEKGSRLLLDTLLEDFDLDEQHVVLFADHPRPADVPTEIIWVEGDPTKESELPKVRLTHARSVIVVGSRKAPPQLADATTILTVFTIRAFLEKQAATRDRKAPLHVVAEVLDSENVAHARAAGADEVIESQRLGFAMLTHTVRYPGLGDLTSQVVASGATSFYVGEQPAGLPRPLTFGALSRAVREATDALVIGVRDPESGEQHINPVDTHPVAPRMEVVYLAEAPSLDREP